jgi:hypothetical protein
MILIWKDNTSPSVTDTITIGGVAQDLSQATVSFKMRDEGATDGTLKVDAAASFITDGSDGRVRYDWQAGDTDTPGVYVGWWSVTFPGGAVQDTPEFEVRVLDHSLSAGALCAVTDVRQRMLLPDEDHTLDAVIQSLILGATTEILAECGRELAPKVTESRRFEIDWYRPTRDRNGDFVIDFGWGRDARVVTSVSLDPDEPSPTVLAAGEYRLDTIPEFRGVYDRLRISAYKLGLRGYSNAAVDSVLSFGISYVEIDGQWGFPAVPDDVKRITVDVVRGWTQRDLSQFGGAVQTQVGTAPAVPAGFELPLFAKRSLNKYRRQVAF